jgi:uncharacterized membrane protein SpoIIM required for sporulation
MNEITFIERNTDRWKEFESLISSKFEASPDKISELFIQITDDLAYARTYFPKSKVAGYLNYLSINVHHKIYKNKKVKSNRFAEFWLLDYPVLVYNSRKYIYYSLLIFITAIVIGALSSAHDANFVRLILGDQYVNMTLENIHKGDPMAVYKQMNPSGMFLAITLNNLWVAFRTAIFGVFLSIGSALSILQNGIMVGAFQSFFYQKGLLWESSLTIFLHGTYELFSIVIAGASGFVIGSGIIFPESYSRLESFKRGVIQGVKLLIGIVPLFIIAAFLEGFITRLTASPLAIKISIILFSLFTILFYFFIYPTFITKKLKNYGRN